MGVSPRDDIDDGIAKTNELQHTGASIVRAILSA